MRFTAQYGYVMVKRSVEIKHYRIFTKKLLFYQTDEFDLGYERQNIKTQVVVTARLRRMREEGYFGWVKKFDGLMELKWTSGLRLYLIEKHNEQVIILLGGNKNGQKKDIEKAKKISKSYFEEI